jgi:hypothetical protein
MRNLRELPHFLFADMDTIGLITHFFVFESVCNDDISSSLEEVVPMLELEFGECVSELNNTIIFVIPLDF